MDKNEFLEKLGKYFRGIQNDTLTTYKKEFVDFLNALLSTAATAYMTNLEEYSVLLKAKQVDKQAMEKLMEKVGSAADALKKSQCELDELIWEALKHET